MSILCRIGSVPGSRVHSCNGRIACGIWPISNERCQQHLLVKNIRTTAVHGGIKQQVLLYDIFRDILIHVHTGYTFRYNGDVLLLLTIETTIRDWMNLARKSCEVRDGNVVLLLTFKWLMYWLLAIKRQLPKKSRHCNYIWWSEHPPTTVLDPLWQQRNEAKLNHVPGLIKMQTRSYEHYWISYYVPILRAFVA